MCGILVSKEGRGNAKFIRRRGNDWGGVYVRRGLKFEHFLLHVTGKRTLQPFVENDVAVLYNGEIYNLPFEDSDGENIIPAYRELGQMFPKALDGEFAIVVYDFAEDVALFVTDRFATKPLWRNGIECASYESGVGGHKVAANTVEAVRLSTGEDLGSVQYHEWDWRQVRTDYDACLAAFEAAVRRRYKRDCFIGLSSGYDSGAIACALRGTEFKAYTVMAAETRKTVLERVSLLSDAEIAVSFDMGRQEKHLAENAEPFRYRIRKNDGRTVTSSYKEDYAAKAFSYICERAHGEGRRVFLSGMGADEILCDYSLIPNQSELKGIYPQTLQPWANFTGSCMYSYLGKEECVGGSWAIESRYPFLDTAFVQSFLSLAPELKNRKYKAPLYEYLTRNHFPFDRDKKIGWAV